MAISVLNEPRTYSEHDGCCFVEQALAKEHSVPILVCWSSHSLLWLSSSTSNSTRIRNARAYSRSPSLTEGVSSGFFFVRLLDNVRMVILMILPSNGPRRSFCSSADFYANDESQPLTPLKASVRPTSSTLRLSRTFRMLS